MKPRRGGTTYRKNVSPLRGFDVFGMTLKPRPHEQCYYLSPLARLTLRLLRLN